MLGANRIEEGCLAIVINSCSGNDGKTVTVGKYIGNVPGYVGNRRWEVDRPMPAIFGEIIYHMQEKQLLRIDGGSFDVLVTDKVLDSELCT